MTNKDNLAGKSTPEQALRQQAEKILKKQTARVLENLEPVLPEDARLILHDLQVHQIELEIQNEELRRTQAEISTERERYFDLYDLAPVGYCTISAEGVVLAANFTTATLLGVERWALVKQHMFQFVHKEDQDIYYLHLKQLAGTGAPQVFELRMVRKDQTECWMRLQAIVAHEPTGTPVYRIALSNITEQKQVEDKIKTSLAEKEVMLKEIHHRVKNNLQVISSLISLQTDNITDKLMRDEFTDLRDRVRSMALIHEKLYQSNYLARLNFADYSTSLLHSLWSSHDVLAEKVKLNFALAPVKLTIETAVPCGLILNELASNALKHAFPNNSDGEVTVGLERDAASDTACLWVRDNGIGLPPSIDWRQSSSLGLRLVQILASQLRGTVETGTGPGAEFRVTFPLNGLNS